MVRESLQKVKHLTFGERQYCAAGCEGPEEPLILRGLVTLALIGGHFLIADLMQRTAIAVWVRLRPSSRERVLSAWMKLIIRTLTAIIERIGGMRMANLPTIPLEPGILVLKTPSSRWPRRTLPE